MEKTAYHEARDLIENLSIGSKFTKESIGLSILKDSSTLYPVKRIKTSVSNAITFLLRHQVIQSLGGHPVIYKKLSMKDLPCRKRLSKEERILALSPAEIGRGILAILKSRQKTILDLQKNVQNLAEDFDSLQDNYTDCQSALSKYKEELIELKRKGVE